MKEPRRPLYIFGWPSFVGGADTKLAHLLVLVHRHFQITLIPNDAYHLKSTFWTRYLDRLGIRYCRADQLPKRLQGIGLCLCNPRFFTDRIANRAKERGLKVIWSSEMIWHHDGEIKAIKQGLIDKVLYVSEFQKEYLAEGYGNTPSCMTGNYIDPAFFPFRERQNQTFQIGRLSRPAPEKYPEDMPVFYELLGLPETRFRLMAWSDELAKKYRWHKFDDRWDLLTAESQSQVDFLHSIDLFVYPLGRNFRESWGRSTVEAMLTGCIPLVPRGHQFHNLIIHGRSGFICSDFCEYQEHARKLRLDYPYRRRISRQCREHAEKKLCNPREHLEMWLQALQ